MGINFNGVDSNNSTQATTNVLNLQKGGILNLSKSTVNLRKLIAGCGWDVPNVGRPYDLDLSAFMLGANGKVNNPSTDVVYFGSPEQRGIKSTGDNRTGAGDGDDEQILVSLNELDPNIKHIVFIVNIFDADKYSQVFGNVKNAYIHLVNDETGDELCRYQLTDEYSTDTAVIVAELFKDESNNWNFKAIGEGRTGDLNVLIGLYM